MQEQELVPELVSEQEPVLDLERALVSEQEPVLELDLERVLVPV